MASCVKKTDCKLFEYCDPNIKRCEKCKLLCSRKIGTLLECKELCQDYLSKKKTLTATIVITEAMPIIGRVNLPSSDIMYTADSESINLFLPLEILIIVLTLLVALLTIKVLHKTGKMTKVPSQNLHGNRLGYSQHHQPLRKSTRVMTTENTEEETVFILSSTDQQSHGSDRVEIHGVKHKVKPSIQKTSGLETKHSEALALIPHDLAPVHIESSQKNKTNKHEVTTDPDLMDRQRENLLKEGGTRDRQDESTHIAQDEISNDPWPNNNRRYENSMSDEKMEDLNKYSDVSLQIADMIPSRSEDTLGTPHVSQQSVNIPVLSEEGSQTPENHEKPVVKTEDSKTKAEKFEINKHIYETLRRIPYVDGYFSDGGTVDVFVDLTINRVSWVLRDLMERTGQPAEKFSVKDTTEQ